MTDSSHHSSVIKAESNTLANIFGIVGCACCFLCPCIGCPFLTVALLQKSTDFKFDDERKELIVHNYGSLFNSCCSSTMEFSYDSISDIEVEVDPSSTVNGENGCHIILLSNDGSGPHTLNRGFIALSKGNKIAQSIKNKLANSQH
ncbi:hypothetical protein FDP41_002870 [Naegleria fowleri]|uniref:Uncharacterized protein n=1 Tax=Naegleria fowleri TaxID=5763 RepID=A0A6A5BYB0_NAEFO|nr:uncharacterized protein FDP41_002870 [Naegleria fowleri]KAF0978355.1 hypothetical protein FDP41_002870 [Naegleria fowleri]CAG4714047.1 unnamed protein product [Naegleria fowleri]